MAKKITESSSEGILKNHNQQYIDVWIPGLLLTAIVLFAVFLRFEDFYSWEKKSPFFQYRGEWQMANFDSYYYLQIAKEIQEGTYDKLQENRRVPNGMQAPAIPPLISVLTSLISSITKVPIATVALFLPIFSASLLAPLMFVFCLKLHFNKIAALTTALFSVISLTYVTRTRIGVFDTDCLNVVFVLLNSYLFFRFAEIKNKHRYVYLGLGFLNSFLFIIWWNTAPSVVVLSGVVPLSAAIIFFYTTKKRLKYGILSLIILLCALLIGDEVMAYVRLILGKTNNAFPNNLSVAELDAAGLDTFIKKTSNNKFISISMLVGIVALCWKMRLKALFLTIPVLLGIIAPFFAGNRFILFSAPILAMGMGYCIQILFNLKKRIKPSLAVIITMLIAVIGIVANYKTITDGHEKPSAFENTHLLNALDKYTPKDANIWTDWDMGYQIQHYLNRGTYADGEFSDGEFYYYVSFPLAAENPEVSANFMRFYNKRGKEGMTTLYDTFSGVEQTFEFLKTVLAYSPSAAEEWLQTQQQKGMLPEAPDLTGTEEWISFLFPEQSEDIYLFIHYKMTQTAAWFKQGNSDLKTGLTKGLPLFLTFEALNEQGSQIKNNQISLNTKTGTAKYFNQPRYFQSLSTFNGVETVKKTFPKPRRMYAGKDDRFIFQWNKKKRFGAAMSKEMANTTLVKLYLLQEKSRHFEPVFINTPKYQIWKITGNAYETE
ncbi:MAG: hypothetical protein GDA37_03120 [Ekhidna sp.]|nr:hypothetical protein [Ekhidna sp.]